jgi:transposase-like protein
MYLSELVDRYNCDEQCRSYLEELRWPKGPSCPRCGGADIARISTRRYMLRCRGCQRQFTVTMGTIFQDSHLPLTKWFLAVLLMCEAKKGMSAWQLKRTLGMAYKTAWYLCMRIREAMGNANESQPKMSGVVEMDETYIGPRERGGKRGRGAKKQIVIGIRQRDGQLRLFKASDTTADTLAKYIKENVQTDDVDVIITDDYRPYMAAMRDTALTMQHRTVTHSKGEYVVGGDFHTNTVESAFSLLKRGMVGSWHRVSIKHLQRYLEEMSYRFGERENPQLFSLTLQNLLTTDPLTFKDLTSEAA